MVNPTNSESSDRLFELRISINLVIGVLHALGVVLAVVSDGVPNILYKPVQTLSLMCYVLSIAGFLLNRWRASVARWFLVIGLLSTVFVGSGYLRVPGVLSLASVPVILAAGIIGVPAAVAAAAGSTVLLVMFRGQVAPYADPATIGVALVAVWVTTGLLAAMYRPIVLSFEWVQDYLQRAQMILDEALARKLELEQALISTANANRQLGLANERMAALRLIAEEAERTKATFVAKVSHEFRTPLNMIIGLVELVLENPGIYAVALPPDMEQDLRVVNKNCQHLSSLVDDVLDLTRVETGRVMLHKENVDVGEIVDQAVATVVPLAEKKGLYLHVNVADDLPMVYCDRTRIRQVVVNLVSNAARFTEQGGIRVNVIARDGRAEVRVEDTGPGVAAPDVERVFEPFCQGDSNIWGDKGGSGLGLSISQQFIRLHSGRLWLESEVGAGSSFVFELPVSSPASHVASPARWIRDDWVWNESSFRTESVGVANSLRKPRVLVYDSVKSLGAELERYVDEVDLVQVGELSGISKELRRCPADAVLVNLVPSVEDLHAWAEDAGLGSLGTPVIGCSVPARDARAQAAGAAGHLTKPVSVKDLSDVLRGVGRPVRRVLVVDDDPDCVQLFARMLRVCDNTLEIATAKSGLEALDRLRETASDLVLLDIAMPDIDGWEVLRRLGQEGQMDGMAVVFVSAQDPAEQPQYSRQLLVTVDEGLSIRRMLRCSLGLSHLLLSPDREPVPVH